MRCASHEERAATLSSSLIERVRDKSISDPLIANIARACLVGDKFSMEEGWRATGLARRQFERRFKSCAGFPPALFARIVRFQRSYRMLENGQATSLTDLAVACGYFDQSHFIRDFKRFSGMNPRTYFKEATEKTDSFVRLPGA